MNGKSLHVLVTCVALMASLSGCAAFAANDAGNNCSVDRQISNSVQNQLDTHVEIGPPNAIHVQTIDRVVYLYGLLDTGNGKSIAEALASRTRGVTKVVNSIEQSN